MKRTPWYRSMIPVYILLLGGLLTVAAGGSRAITVVSENARIAGRKTVIIDAGHGGVDGGATSCSGVLESQINLEIALRLDDLMHLLGIQTKMIRTTDCSIHTKGETIAAKKVSDLKERVRITNETAEGYLISIHQNYFTDSRYSGAQVFYPETDGSKDLAGQLQSALVQTINQGSKRTIKPADGIYLMEHVEVPGVLIECGFLSNPPEETRLRDSDYQKKLCCVIVSVFSRFLSAESEPMA